MSLLLTNKMSTSYRKIIPTFNNTNTKSPGIILISITCMIFIWRILLHAKNVFDNNNTVQQQQLTIITNNDENNNLFDEQMNNQQSNSISASSAARKRVCTISVNPRQGSLFRRNRLGRMGSGDYAYGIRKNTCPWELRSVRLISYVKCCQRLTDVNNAITDAMQTHDVVIVTGDEYCLVTDTRPHFRQYYGPDVISTNKNGPTTLDLGDWKPSKEMLDINGTRFPLYLPLGPRDEFLPVKEEEIVPVEQRKYAYNFLGSMTSRSRSVLKQVVTDSLLKPEKMAKWNGFIHITDKWKMNPTATNGYVDPDRYRQILLNSVFTLCPTGHNPEAYRIFEALEAGSIPILSLDPWYYHHRCKSAFRPFRDAGAPFIYLNGGWNKLEGILENRMSNMTWLKERQQAVRTWYKNWMHDTAIRFERILEARYQLRMKRSPLKSSDVDNVALQNEEKSTAMEEKAVQAEEDKFESLDPEAEEAWGDVVVASGVPDPTVVG
jgi:hypothetical protein